MIVENLESDAWHGVEVFDVDVAFYIALARCLIVRKYTRHLTHVAFLNVI